MTLSSCSPGVRWPVLVLLIGATILFLVGLGMFPVVDPSEGYYVEAAREMVESGDFITPHLNNQIYFSKPILTFWLIAASFKMFGVSEVAGRIPFAILCIALVLGTYFVGSQLSSQRGGLIAGWILATSPLLLMVARKSPVDVAFTFFLNIAVLITALQVSGKTNKGWVSIGVGLGLAALAKGPAAFVLFAISLILFMFVVWKLGVSSRSLIAPLHIGKVVAVCVLVVLPWDLAVSMATNGLFLKVFLVYENFSRYLGHTNLSKLPIWYYFFVLVYGFSPWFVLLPALFQKRLLVAAKTESASLAMLYLGSWSLATFCFFSMSGTKLDTYLLPIFPAISVLLGSRLDDWLDEFQGGMVNLPWMNIYCKAVLVCGLVIAGTVAVGSSFFPAIGRDVQIYFMASAVVLALGSTVQYGAWLQKKIKVAVFVILATGFSVCAIAVPAGFQAGGRLFQDESLKALALQVGAQNRNIAFFGSFRPAAMFYARAPMDTFFDAGRLVNKPGVDQSIIIDEAGLPVLAAKHLPLRVVRRQGNWCWVEVKDHVVQSLPTLTEMFSDERIFEQAVSHDLATGPLTVPFADGSKHPEVPGVLPRAQNSVKESYPRI